MRRVQPSEVPFGCGDEGVEHGIELVAPGRAAEAADEPPVAIQHEHGRSLQDPEPFGEVRPVGQVAISRPANGPWTLRHLTFSWIEQ